MIDQDIFTNSKEQSQYLLLIQLGFTLEDTLLNDQITLIEQTRELECASFFIPTVFENHFNIFLSQVTDAYLRSKKLNENKRDDIHLFLSNAAEVYGEIGALARGCTNPADENKAPLYSLIHEKMLEEMLALKFDNSGEDNQHINKFSLLKASQIIDKVNNYCGSNPHFSASLRSKREVKISPKRTFMAGWGGWFVVLVAVVTPLAIAVLLPPMSFSISVFLGAFLGFCSIGLLLYTCSKVIVASNQYNKEEREFNEHQKQEHTILTALTQFLVVDKSVADAPAELNDNFSPAVDVSLGDNDITLFGNKNSGMNSNNNLQYLNNNNNNSSLCN